MPTRSHFKENRDKRREEATVRQAERNNRSDAQQLARLENEGFGQCQEAQRLRGKQGA